MTKQIIITELPEDLRNNCTYSEIEDVLRKQYTEDDYSDIVIVYDENSFKSWFLNDECEPLKLHENWSSPEEYAAYIVKLLHSGEYFADVIVFTLSDEEVLKYVSTAWNREGTENDNEC